MADVKLFDLEEFTQTADQRSVGELLVGVDRQARALLIDVTEDHAAQMLQTWPTLVSAAANLWQALPRPRVQATEMTTPINRVAQISDSISRRLTTSPWPPSTAPDPRMIDMADTLNQAVSLLERFADHVPPSGSGREDLDAAQPRIMHSLYVAAHAVTVALVQHGRIPHDQDAATPRTTPPDQNLDAVALSAEWVCRMAAAEAAAASFATHGRLPALLNGEKPGPQTDTSRLTRALAHWDVQAHRGLVTPKWRDNMVLITRTQALIAGNAMVLVEASVTDGNLDSSPRLLPALGRAGAAWSDLSSRWDDLTPLNVRPSRQLLLAAGELRAAARELTHEADGIATPHIIAPRPGLHEGLHEGLQAILHALENASELAYVVAEKGTTPGLMGRARALSIRAHNEGEAGHTEAGYVVPLEGDIVWVSPTDILAKHMVAAPPPVTDGIRASSQAVVQAATVAAAVTSSFAGPRPSTQQPLTSRGARRHRQTHDAPSTLGANPRRGPQPKRA